MAGSSTREGSPEGHVTTGISGAVTTFPAIVALLAVGLALRFIIAYVLLPGSGFPNDLSAFQSWGNDIARTGPVGFYDRAGFLDYPPVYLLLLGTISRIFGGDLGGNVKMLPILSDIGLAAIVWYMVMELGGSSKRAIIAALIVLVNPITWFNSAIWGQADAVGSIFLLLGLRELQKDRRETASILAVLAALTKLQLGILGVVVGVVVLRRSLMPKSGPAQPERVLTSIGAGLLTGAAVCLPFTGITLDFVGRLHNVAGLITLAVGLLAGLGVVFLALRYLPIKEAGSKLAASAVLGAGTAVLFLGMVFDSIVTHLANTFGEYPFLTLNAYNPWALVGRPSGEAMGRSLSWIRDANFTDPETGIMDPGFVVGPFSPQFVAGALVLAAVLVAGAVFVWSKSRSTTDGVRPDWAGELRGLAATMAVAGVTLGILAVATGPGLSAALVGDGCLIAVLAGVALWAAWRDDSLSLLVALAVLSIAFFVIPTRVHERYLFPFFALGAILLALSWRWTVAYAALAFVNMLNLVSVLVQYDGLSKPDAPTSVLLNAPLPDLSRQVAGTLMDWGHFIQTARWGFDFGPFGWEGIWPITLSALVTGAAMIWVLLQMRGVSHDRLAREAIAAGVDDGNGWLDRIFGTSADVQGGTRLPDGYIPSEPGAVAGTAPTLEEGEYGMEGDYVYEEDRPQYVPDFVMSIWHRLARRSVLPDRSKSLNSEPRGRLDKMDLWVVAALIIVILSMRVWRLGEPTDMHFDEVYHARTATEFLQDFKYGINHDIYEWTHPHFAKYAIAAGINTFSDNKVTSTGNIKVPVKDVLVQPRTAASPAAEDQNTAEKTASPDARYGDRVFVATGSEVRVFDLTTRAQVYSYPIPGAAAFSKIGTTGLLYVGTTDGRIYRIDSNSLDDVRAGTVKTAQAAVLLNVKTGIKIAHIYTDTPPYAIVADTSGNVVSVDLTGNDGVIVGRGNVPGASDFTALGTGPATVTVDPKQVTSAVAAASQLAADVPGVDAGTIESALNAGASGGLEIALPLGPLTADQVTIIQGQIDAGKLPGISISTSSPQILVAYNEGIGSLDARHLIINSIIPTEDPATSFAINTDKGNDVYVTAGASIVLISIDASGGTSIATKDGFQPLSRMPAVVTKVVFDKGTNIAHALGRTQDGQAWTVYAIESNANAVFSDARLPFEPVAIGLDSSPRLTGTSHEALLAFAADGSTATIDVGQFAFSWRVVGVMFGVLMAVCMYLLARLLFRRRMVGLLVAVFSMTDGMLFVQSRIAMNDTYVGGLLLLAYLIFAMLWLNKWRSPKMAWAAFWIGMPILGVTLGLALSAKWVAAYAMASIAVLILIRSALGRVLTVGGLAALTGVLGYQGIAEMKTLPNTGNPAMASLLIVAAAVAALAGGAWVLRTRTTPDKVLVGFVTVLGAGLLFIAGLMSSPQADQNGAPNYTFFLISLAITVLAAAGCAYRPVAWTRQEFWFAIIVGGLAGVGAGYLGLRQNNRMLELAGVAFIVGPAIVFWLAGQLGFGPLAVPPGPDNPARFAEPATPAPTGWLRFGSGFGLPAIWMTVCLAILPFVIYALMYIPWVMPWHQQTEQTGPLPVIACLHYAPESGLCDNGWPAGHTGQDLWALTIQMYNYHNDLRASHAASSPWWAWPMDLKPVWFESDGYAYDQGSWIHDGGNPALWWLAIFGMGFITWQAYKRRNLGLALIAVAFFWQWLSWARIDRAAFQYHFYTALPFFLMALAYFLAELWHGPSRKTWLLARFAAAAALIFPALMWLGKPVACSIARVNTTEYFGNSACGTSSGSVVLEARYVLIGLLLLGAFVAMGLTLVRLERRQAAGIDDRNWPLQLLATPLIALLPLIWLGQNGPRDIIFSGSLPSEMIAWVMLPLLAVLGAVALTARNPRRFVLGVCIIAAAAFLALYPDLSALPIPAAIQGTYYALLPTWMYGFQFSVNLQESASVPLVSLSTATMAGFVLFAAGVAAWVAWERRVVVGFRRARAGIAGDPADTGHTGDTGEPTGEDSPS